MSMQPVLLNANQLMRLVKESYSIVSKSDLILAEFTNKFAKDPFDALDNSLKVFDAAAMREIAQMVINNVLSAQKYAEEHSTPESYEDVLSVLVSGVLNRRGFSDEGTANLANTARQKACAYFLREYFREIPITIKYC